MKRAILFAIALLSLTSFAFAQSYTVHDLSSNFNTPYHSDRATAINGSGTIAVSGYEDGKYLTKVIGSSVRTIDSLYHNGDHVNAINANGQMVGRTSDHQGWSYGTVWNADGSIESVFSTPSELNEINDASMVIGTLQSMAVVQTPTSTKYLTASGAIYTEGFDINNKGVAVGKARSGQWGFYSNPCRWDAKGNAYIFPNLATSSNQIGWFTSLNDSGYAVGLSLNNKTQIRAVIAGPFAKTLRDIGTLGGGSSQANRINNNRWVIGSSYDKKGIEKPFVWHDGRMYELEVMDGCKTGEALDINDDGTIVGYCKDGSGHTFACMWTL